MVSAGWKPYCLRLGTESPRLPQLHTSYSGPRFTSDSTLNRQVPSPSSFIAVSNLQSRSNWSQPFPTQSCLDHSFFFLQSVSRHSVTHKVNLQPSHSHDQSCCSCVYLEHSLASQAGPHCPFPGCACLEAMNHPVGAWSGHSFWSKPRSWVLNPDSFLETFPTLWNFLVCPHQCHPALNAWQNPQ